MGEGGGGRGRDGGGARARARARARSADSGWRLRAQISAMELSAGQKVGYYA